MGNEVTPSNKKRRRGKLGNEVISAEKKKSSLIELPCTRAHNLTKVGSTVLDSSTYENI